MYVDDYSVFWYKANYPQRFRTLELRGGQSAIFWRAAALASQPIADCQRRDFRV